MENTHIITVLAEQSRWKNKGNKVIKVRLNLLKNNSDFTQSELGDLDAIIKTADPFYNSILSKALSSNDYEIIASKSGGGFHKGINILEAPVWKDGATVEGSVFYHECGHLVDFVDYGSVGEDGLINRQSISISWVSEKNNSTLEKMVKQEAKHLVTDENLKRLEGIREEYTKRELNKLPKGADIYEKTRAKFKGYEEFLKTYADLSDMISAQTKGGNNLGAGHSWSYWGKTKGLQAQEFFAEVYQAKAVNKKSLDVIKEYFPKSVEIFDEFMERFSRR